jgi:hypothetical protein
MNYYIKLPDRTRVGPFKTIGAVQLWAHQRGYDEFSVHFLQNPDLPNEMRHEQGPDH